MEILTALFMLVVGLVITFAQETDNIIIRMQHRTIDREIDIKGHQLPDEKIDNDDMGDWSQRQFLGQRESRVRPSYNRDRRVLIVSGHNGPRRQSNRFDSSDDYQEPNFNNSYALWHTEPPLIDGKYPSSLVHYYSPYRRHRLPFSPFNRLLIPYPNFKGHIQMKGSPSIPIYSPGSDYRLFIPPNMRIGPIVDKTRGT